MHLTRLIFRLLSAMCLYANPAFIRDFTVYQLQCSLETVRESVYKVCVQDVWIRVPKVRIRTYFQRSIRQYTYRFLYNDFYFNDRFLLVNPLLIPVAMQKTLLQ